MNLKEKLNKYENIHVGLITQFNALRDKIVQVEGILSFLRIEIEEENKKEEE